MVEVSVITPTYNSGQYLAETIGSVQNQTFSDWEMILSDDFSTDDTVAIAKKMAAEDSRIRILRAEKNMGPALARKSAFEAASGRYLAFLDSDDLWHPEKLKTQIEFMKSNDSVFSFTEYEYMDDRGNSLGQLVPVVDSVNYRSLLKNTRIGCLTVMLDRTRVGELRTVSMSQHVDLPIWYAILKKGHVARGIPQNLARYRIVGDSVSRNKFKSAIHMWHGYRNVENLAFLDSTWCFVNYGWNAYWKNRASMSLLGS